jgi:3-deoxy-D-manno-octulosonic-acid transferase
MAAVPLVRALRARWPDTPVVLSTVTATGAEMARTRLGDVEATFVFPLDFASAVRRVLVRVRPRCFIALETELWPNVLRCLAETGVPAVLANGRISDRSFRRYGWVRPLFRRVLAHVALFAMQSEEDARRVVSLGAPPERVRVTGNLKMEAPTEATGPGDGWRARLGWSEAPVWVAGSTHRGEEPIVLDALVGLRRRDPSVRLVLAPRHPERAEEVLALARGRGLVPVRRTRLDAEGPVDLVVVDTIGDLVGFYRGGDVVFVGGSLVPVGGHNVIEPALCRRAVVFGPHMTNFREATGLLLETGGAVQLRDATELLPTLEALLQSPERRQALGEAAWRAVGHHQGACQRTIASIEETLRQSGRGDGR